MPRPRIQRTRAHRGPNQRSARARSSRVRPGLLVSLGLIAGVIAGCMTTVSLPPQFRFSCDTDEDCQVIVDEEGNEMYREECISGLCQFPCQGNILTTIPGECPANDYFGCFNGVCTHLCSTVTKLCPYPQQCIVQDVPDEFVDMIPADIDLDQTGVCGIPCDREDSPECPEGQVCFDGVCIGFGGGGTGTGTGDSGGGNE